MGRAGAHGRASQAGGAVTLSRRDRAACELALSELRRADDVDMAGVRDLLGLSDRMERVGSQAFLAWWYEGQHMNAPRIIEVRLALYLRALLRADRGDVYSIECDACRHNGRIGRKHFVRWRFAGDVVVACDTCDDYIIIGDLASLRITPLWELAPCAT